MISAVELLLRSIYTMLSKVDLLPIAALPYTRPYTRPAPVVSHTKEQLHSPSTLQLH